jgi:hypothetical protein
VLITNEIHFIVYWSKEKAKLQSPQTQKPAKQLTVLRAFDKIKKVGSDLLSLPIAIAFASA